jgi:glycosyltransferase involved in cell wall biosynthesis
MRSGPKTLIVLAPGFPKNEADTSCLPAQQQFIRQLQFHLPEWTVIVLSFQYPPARKTYRWHQVAVVSFGITRGFYAGLRWLAVWRTLRRLERSRRLSGLLSFWYTECGLLGTLYGRFRHIPHYSWILGRDALKENWIPRLVCPRPDELIAISDSLAGEFHKNHGVRPRHIIPAGIDSRIFGPPAGKRDIDLLGAGSLIPLKQYRLFIDTVAMLASEFPELRSVICGKGILEAELRGQIDRLEVGDHLSLAGEKPHAEVLGLMGRARVFLHPSAYEGFSGACLEALFAGAHVVSFCDPMGTTLPHWHVVGNQAEMYSMVRQLLSDPCLDGRPVMPYPIENTARDMANLFGAETTAYFR